MKVARNITKAPDGTFRVRIRREYLDQPIQRHFQSQANAERWRNAQERLNPIRSPHHHPKKPRCPACGQRVKN